MLSFSLPTFVKLCHLDPHQLLNEIDKKLNSTGPGHSFHWSLRKAIYAHIDGAAEQEIDGILNTPTKDAERKYNRAAYEKFKSRFGNNRSLEKIEDTESHLVREHGIEIRVEPWFSTIEKGQLHLHVVWANASPDLIQRNANIGCLVISEAFATTRFGNSRYCIMDLTKPKRFTDKTVSSRTQLALENTCASIARCAQQV